MLDLGQPQRLGEREQLDRRALLAGELVHPVADELDQRGGHRRQAGEPPEAALGDQPAAVDGPEHELARVQRVALAAVEDPAVRLLLRPGRRAPPRRASRSDAFVEAAELETLRAAVLPQRDDRVRARLARADRRDARRRRHTSPGAARARRRRRRAAGRRRRRATIGRPAARSRNVCALSRRRSKAWSERTASGSRRANAPSGIIAALRVACTHSVIAPPRSRAASASRPRRDLPAPASAPHDDPAAAVARTRGRPPRALRRGRPAATRGSPRARTELYGPLLVL